MVSQYPSADPCVEIACLGRSDAASGVAEVDDNQEDVDWEN